MVLHLSEKRASTYRCAKNLKVVGNYLSESLAPTYHTTKCHNTVAMYLSEISAPTWEFKRRHTGVAWYLTERLAQSCHTTRRLDIGDHNKVLHSIKTFLTYLLTYSREQSHSWEVNSFAGSQEIRRLLRNPGVHFHIHKRLPPVPILT